MAGIPEDSRVAALLARHPQWKTWALACALAVALFVAAGVGACVLMPAPEDPSASSDSPGVEAGPLEPGGAAAGSADAGSEGAASKEGEARGAVGGAVAEATDPEGAVPEEGQAEAPAQETREQMNAFMSAKMHLEEMPYSHAGIVAALEAEGCSHEDAVYAADKLGVDWSRKAAEMAAQYLDTMEFTREDLVDQLIYEGFTREQAEAGATAVGL